MRKQLKKNTVGLLFCISVCAQVHAQKDVLASVQAKLASYNAELFPEKLYVRTDKSFYVTGDIVWFKIYAVDGLFQEPLVLSKVAYVEIIDSDNKPVLRSKIELGTKGGDGSLQLPLSMYSGNYILRAYTNWMKNQGADQFFEKAITVINPFRNPDIPEGQANPYILNVFPEGGNLVKGLPSRVAYRLTDKYGKGVSGKGCLLNERNDTLSFFSPLKFGMGSFDLVPEADHSYRVLFVMDDRQIIAKPLPEAYEKGFVLSVKEEGSRVTLTVRTNANSEAEISLLVQARQRISIAKKLQFVQGIATTDIDKALLPEGVSQFTVFNSNGQPVCERLFFNQPSIKSLINIQPDKKNYGLRQDVLLGISSLPAEANLSLSVYKTDSFQKSEAADIVTYLWLQSELSGPVEQPEYYLTASGAEANEAADHLMLTQGWRRFKWEEVLNDAPLVKFPVESSGHRIRGKVVDARTNEMAPFVDVYLTIPDSKYKLYVDQSDARGFVNFDVSDYYGPGEIIAQTNSEKDSFYRVEFLSPFSEEYTNGTSPGIFIGPEQQRLLESYSISMQAQNIYNADSIRKFSAPQISDTTVFFGKGIYSYDLDAYSRFTTMEEVLREYVREINVGTSEGLRLKLLNEDQKAFSADDILVVVDGVPFFDTHKIFALDPLKFKRIDVITKNYLLGSRTFKALASFSTYQGNYEGIEVDPKAVTIDYEGLQLKREFYAPDYSTIQLQKSKLPDLRTTLLWMPDVTNKEIHLFTGDNKGKFLVVLQGITGNGNPVTATSAFEVK